jgi:hypothetical protein
MEISPLALFRMLLWALALGAALGAVYDGIRVLRLLCGEPCPRLREKRLPLIGLVWPSPRPVRAALRALRRNLEDLVFFGFAGACFSVLLYVCNRGQFRGFALAALPAGFGLYALTLGRLVRRLSDWLAFCVRAIWKYAVFCVLLPLRLLGKAACWLLRRIGAWMLPHIRARRAILRDRRYRKDLLRQAERGFLPAGGNKRERGRHAGTRQGRKSNG